MSRPTVDNSINSINTSRLLDFLLSWFSTCLLGLLAGWLVFYLSGWLVENSIEPAGALASQIENLTNLFSAARVSADTGRTVLEGSGVFGTGENQFDV